MYATHGEDIIFWDSKWVSEVGKDKRIIIHDIITIGLPTASDGDQQ